MRNDPPVGPRPRKLRVAASIILAVVVVLALVLALGSVLLRSLSGENAFTRVWSALTSRTLSIDVSQPTMVERIRRLQRLETVVYTMDKIVSGANESPIFPDFLAGDRLIMLVHGEVVAGIDFSEFKLEDLRIENKEIRLHLPSSQVFRTRLDSEKTRVYSRQTGWLVPTDPNLESRVRQAAEQQIQQAALDNGILQTAQQNGIATISTLLKGLGFEKINFE